MKNIIVLIVCFFIVFNGKTQTNKGYYNSKFYVSLDALANSPILYNFRSKSDEYSKYDKNLNQKADKFNYGFRASFGVIIKRNFALCLEGGIDYANIYLEKSIYYQDSMSSMYMNITHQKLDIQTYSFMPKIEFSVKNSLLPLGLSHQIGIGFNRTTLIDRNYNSFVTHNDYSDNSDIQIQDFKERYFDFSNQSSTKTYTLLYAINMKTALSKSLLLNYGFRYTLNLHSSEVSNNFDFVSNVYYLQKDYISNLIYKQRLYNLINFNIGLTYAF